MRYTFYLLGLAAASLAVPTLPIAVRQEARRGSAVERFGHFPRQFTCLRAAQVRTIKAATVTPSAGQNMLATAQTAKKTCDRI